MSYFPRNRPGRKIEGNQDSWKQVLLAWLVAMMVLALIMMIIAGGRFPKTWHSAAAAGPLLGLYTDSFLDPGPMVVGSYAISIGVAFHFRSMPLPWLWLAGWMISGLGILFYRLVHHFAT